MISLSPAQCIYRTYYTMYISTYYITLQNLCGLYTYNFPSFHWQLYIGMYKLTPESDPSMLFLAISSSPLSLKDFLKDFSTADCMHVQKRLMYTACCALYIPAYLCTPLVSACAGGYFVLMEHYIQMLQEWKEVCT